MTFILDQLARTGLLPDSTSTAILGGKHPPLSDLIPPLVILSMDAEAVTAGDKTATWNQRRLSRQILGLTFLTAILLYQLLEPEQHCNAVTATQETSQ
jgi:hypothetical protein